MWKFQELFTLAISSEEGRHGVRELTSSLDPPLKISDVEGASGILEITRDGGVPCKIRCFDEPTFVKMIENHDEEYPEFLTFQQNGTELKMTFLDETQAICVVQENLELASLLLVEFFKDVFSAQFDDLTIAIERENLEALNTDGLQKNINFKVEFGYVSYREMRMVLSQKCHSADLGCVVRQGFVYDEPITTPNLTIRYAHWFTRDNLLSLNSSRIRLSYSNLGNEDLNLFITQWLISDNTKLEHFAIYETFPNTMVNLDTSIVTHGMELIEPSDKSQFLSSLELEGQEIEYEKGIDIRRASDGALATIVCSQNPQGLRFFAFVVWKHLKPAELAPGASEAALAQFQHLSLSEERRAELRRILEVPQDNLNLTCDIGSDFHFDKPINVRNLQITHSQWFSAQNLLNLSSEIVQLRNSTLSNEALNAFLHQWINSGDKKLLHFSMITDKPLDINFITGGILTEPGSDKSDLVPRLQIEEALSVAYDNGLDIERDTDGITATVLVDKTTSGMGYFVFTVWK